MEDESKLPKWAQQRLDGLRVNLADVEKKLKAIGGEMPTDVFFASGCEVGEEEMSRLPVGTRVRYRLGPNWMDFIEFTVKEEEGEKFLNVYGGRQLTIKPRVCNGVYLGLQKEDW